MKIREFVISIVSKFDSSGFNAADRATERLTDDTDDATAATKRLGAAQSQVGSVASGAAGKVRKLGETTSSAGQAAKRAGSQARDASGRFGSAGARASGARKGISGFGSSLASLAGPAKAGAVAIGSLVAAATLGAGAIISQGSTFEGFRAQLTTLFGDAGEAEKAFSGIKDFAKKTPFEIDQVTRAFIALKTRGVNPTDEALTGLGDLASSRGQTIEDVVSAATAAARGELDSLEGFIDGAKVSGDKLALSFKGQTVEVDKNAAAVTKALVAFGQMEGVAGGMAAQSATTAGVISNLRGGIENFFDEVAQLGVLDEFKGLLDDIAGAGGDEQGGLAQILADTLIAVLRSLREAVKKVTAEDIKGFFNAAKSAAQSLATGIGLVSSAFRFIIDTVGGTEQAMQTFALGVVAITAAFYGPAGLVVAAGAAGLAIGGFLNSLGADDALASFLGDLTGLNRELDELDRINGGRTTQRGAPKIGEKVAENPASLSDVEKYRRKKGETTIRGGAKFLAPSEETPFDIKPADTVRFSKNGEQVFSDVATLESIASGATKSERLTQAEATSALETALAGDIKANQDRAMKRGKQSAAAAKAAKTGGGKGKGGADPYDFVEKARSAAKSQAGEFAEREFQRLRFEGIAVERALSLSKEAGHKRASELEAQFLAAGRVYDTTSQNILDMLGLTGVGSVLEGRPPPSTVIINISPEINLVKDFTMQVSFTGGVTGAAGVEQAVSAGMQTAVTQGVLPFKAEIQALIESMFKLQGDLLIKQGAGGRQPQGVQG